MKCPFLTGRYMYTCTANSEAYIPSQFELEEYCRGKRHTMCPFYMKFDTDWEPKRNIVYNKGSDLR